MEFRRTLHDLYSLYFLPEVIVKFMSWVRGHFVILIKIALHVPVCALLQHRLILIWWESLFFFFFSFLAAVLNENNVMNI